MKWLTVRTLLGKTRGRTGRGFKLAASEGETPLQGMLASLWFVSAEALPAWTLLFLIAQVRGELVNGKRQVGEASTS